MQIISFRKQLSKNVQHYDNIAFKNIAPIISFGCWVLRGGEQAWTTVVAEWRLDPPAPATTPRKHVVFMRGSKSLVKKFSSQFCFEVKEKTGNWI